MTLEEAYKLAMKACEETWNYKTCMQIKYVLGQKEKIGKWIDEADKIDAQYGKHSYKCPKCGKYAEYFVSGTEVWWDRIKPNFCPNCGVRMFESQESEDKK